MKLGDIGSGDGMIEAGNITGDFATISWSMVAAVVSVLVIDGGCGCSAGVDGSIVDII